MTEDQPEIKRKKNVVWESGTFKLDTRDARQVAVCQLARNDV
jgi:hypothetical protein